MSISDRLDEIRARIIRAREGRLTDRYLLLDVDAPAMVNALQAVLDRHQKGTARIVEGIGGRDVEHCLGCYHCGQTEEWPCPTVHAIENALQEMP